MQTITGQTRVVTTASSSLITPFSQASGGSEQSKRLKIKDFMSWSICFAVIAAITGTMKWMSLAVTMETITSGLFYLSMAGLVYFVFRIFALSANPVQSNPLARHELN
jgi:hypothetical protein